MVNGLAAGQQTANQTQPSTKFPALSTAEIIHSELLSSGREPFDSNQPAGTPVCSMLSMAPRMRQGQKTALQHKSLVQSLLQSHVSTCHWLCTPGCRTTVCGSGAAVVHVGENPQASWRSGSFISRRLTSCSHSVLHFFQSQSRNFDLEIATCDFVTGVPRPK